MLDRSPLGWLRERDIDLLVCCELHSGRWSHWRTIFARHLARQQRGSFRSAPVLRFSAVVRELEVLEHLRRACSSTLSRILQSLSGGDSAGSAKRYLERSAFLVRSLLR